MSGRQVLQQPRSESAPRVRTIRCCRQPQPSAAAGCRGSRQPRVGGGRPREPRCPLGQPPGQRRRGEPAKARGAQALLIPIRHMPLSSSPLDCGRGQCAAAAGANVSELCPDSPAAGAIWPYWWHPRMRGAESHGSQSRTAPEPRRRCGDVGSVAAACRRGAKQLRPRYGCRIRLASNDGENGPRPEQRDHGVTTPRAPRQSAPPPPVRVAGEAAGGRVTGRTEQGRPCSRCAHGDLRRRWPGPPWSLRRVA